jgi:hypothetical protein
LPAKRWLQNSFAPGWSNTSHPTRWGTADLPSPAHGHADRFAPLANAGIADAVDGDIGDVTSDL